MTFSNVSKHRAVPNGMDPPEHTRYRQAINPFFVPARMTAFEPETRQLAGKLVESMLARTTFDFVSDFSGPFLLPVALRLPWVAGRHVNPSWSGRTATRKRRCREIVRPEPCLRGSLPTLCSSR